MIPDYPSFYEKLIYILLIGLFFLTGTLAVTAAWMHDSNNNLLGKEIEYGQTNDYTGE